MNQASKTALLDKISEINERLAPLQRKVDLAKADMDKYTAIYQTAHDQLCELSNTRTSIASDIDSVVSVEVAVAEAVDIARLEERAVADARVEEVMKLVPKEEPKEDVDG